MVTGNVVAIHGTSPIVKLRFMGVTFETDSPHDALLTRGAIRITYETIERARKPNIARVTVCNCEDFTIVSMTALVPDGVHSSDVLDELEFEALHRIEISHLSGVEVLHEPI